MAGSLVAGSPLQKISLLGDSQTVRMVKVWKQCAGCPRLETSCAFSGWTTGQLREAVNTKVSGLEETCFIFIGVNDVIRNFSHQDMVQNLKVIIKHLIYHNKTILISTLPPLLHSSPEQEQLIKFFNVRVQSYSTHNSITVIPFHRVFPPFSEGKLEFYQLKYYNGRKDNVHLSPAGLKKLMELIISALGGKA